MSLSEYTFDRYYSLWTNWIFVFLLVQLFCWYANRLQIQIYGNDAHSLLYFLSDASGLSFLFDNPLLIATWWYMSLAFLLILVFPICFWLYQKLDVYFFPLIFIFTPFLIELFFPLGRYIGTFVLGMYCADKMIFEKLKSREMFNQSILSKIIKFIILTIFLYYLIKFRQAKGHGSFYFINDGIIPMFVIYYCFEFINDIKYLNSFLEYIGIHSMNIFLIHNFIRVVYFESWTYSFKYWWLIVLVLLIESIILSVAIEKLIKIIKYDKLLISIKKKIKKVLF